MAPILLETICTTTVATRLNFPERLYGWQECPATAWRERDGRFMVACVTLSTPVIVAVQALAV